MLRHLLAFYKVAKKRDNAPLSKVRSDCRIPGPAINMCRCALKNEAYNYSCYSYSNMSVCLSVCLSDLFNEMQNSGPGILQFSQCTDGK